MEKARHQLLTTIHQQIQIYNRQSITIQQLRFLKRKLQLAFDLQLVTQHEDQLKFVLSKVSEQIDEQEQLLQKQAQKRNKKVITKKETLKRIHDEISKVKNLIFTLIIALLVPLFFTILVVSSGGPNKITYNSSNEIKQKQVIEISGRQYIALGISVLVLIIIITWGWGCCCSYGYFTQQLKRLESQKLRLETQIENLEKE